MSYLQFDLLFLALPIAVLARRGLPRRALLAAGALVAVALVWTAPWDEHLVRTGVWSYDGARVLGRLGSVPLEEYAFVALEVLLVVAWGTRTGRLGRASTEGPRGHGAWLWAGVFVAGVALLVVGGQVRYLGLLLVWAAPPLALQHAVAGDLLGGQRLRRALLAGPVALWLCAADRLALADGVWAISPASSTGVMVLGLPVEEALFFVLTCTLVADGLLLATDRRALARAAAVLRVCRPSASGPARSRAVGSASWTTPS